MALKKTKTPIKAFFFDLGQVIVHFDFEPAFRRLSLRSPLKPEEIRDYFIVSGLEVLYDGGKISSGEFYRTVKKGLGHTLSYKDFARIWNNIFTLNNRTAALIKRLKARRYRLILVSNTNEMHYRHIRRNYPILKYFDSHVLSFRERVRKPDERIYRIAMRACGAAPDEVFYIDDRKDLTEAAGAIGIHTHTFRNDHERLLKKIKSLGVSI